ncbi:protein trunk [Harmonia axyridis]|uniref:protein trunk n=1 Tax=Harmonia axyridis TaxID=115357 RepID=UPI001E275AA7|nr:protein trunk [Harmonia axyridis]
MFAKLLIFSFLIVPVYMAALLMDKRDDLECDAIPKDILEEVLGASFNPRYMSIDPPVETGVTNNGRKRASSYDMDFYVDDNHYEELINDAAWVVTNHVKIEESKRHISHRFKRSTRSRAMIPKQLKEWECESMIVWKDLGTDYFPQFLRTVECTQKKCWYGMYNCSPRSFTVKILRRKTNVCVLAERGMIIGYKGIPRDLREMWVWEERAVNFCCDCTAN